MTDDYTFFAQNGTVSICIDESATPQVFTKVMAVQNCSFEVSFETNDLYEWGDVRRVDSARYEAKVSCSLEYAKILNEDFFKYIVDPHAGASALATGVSIANTTDLKRFSVRATIPDTKRNKQLVITATDVYFKNLPFSGELGEWVKMNLEGNGKDITLKMENYTPTTNQVTSAPAPTKTSDGGK